jgi:hypothetical protein
LIAVRPLRGTPKTTYVVTARALAPLAGGGRNYHFILKGPGDPDCRGRRYSALGYDTPEGGYYVARYRPRRDPLDPTTPPEDWCPGRFEGRVEIRDPGDLRRTRVVGRFAFTVEPSAGTRD